MIWNTKEENQMKISEIRVGDKVSDRWWPWEVGTVRKVFKTRVRIRFSGRVMTYDKAHIQFLEKEK
ncbi:hypothetical protein LCGC14_1419370 [marine sediment metagenome]|uniref:Uncharacterized protein n=1 Tax=marine sediment metagenome TaxID=412755 RepID=A0A0F9M7D1_9ZZZZ